MSISPVPGIPFQRIVNAMLRQMYGNTCTFKQLDEFYEANGYMPFYIRKDPSLRVSKGVYRIPTEDDPLSTYGPKDDGTGAEVHVDESDELRVDQPVPDERPTMRHDKSASTSDLEERLQKLADEASLMSVVPVKNPAFVPFGDYEMILNVIRSKKFFPIFTTGPSGNGKTMFPEQACAELGREFINIDITSETDEDDLIGGFRLKNGETYFEMGPATVAMLRGSLLVLNELDLASNKIMCLQRVLEGKPLTIKKLGIVITPAEGFNVVATANTKGRGDDKGRYVGTGFMNEAMLERFPITIEQMYPDVDKEQQILQLTYKAAGGVLKATPVTFFNTLAKWADAIRKSYEADGVEDLISTRRLCHIVRAYQIFNGDQNMALTFCLQRFDSKTRVAFSEFYNKIAPAKAGQMSNVGANPPSF